jgi:membrane-associated phospholipid phosphatase
MKRHILIGIGIGLLLLFYVFSSLVKHEKFRSIDFAVTVKIQDRLVHEGRIDTDTIMEGMTFFASPEVSVVWVLLLAAIVSYDWKRKKLRVHGAVLCVGFFLLVMAELYGKNVVHHPSPPFFMIRNPTTIFPKYYINEAFSYPSGHAARALFLMAATITTLWPLVKRRSTQIIISIFGCAYVFLVFLSRIYLGHHWLSDIIGGSVIGAAAMTLYLGITGIGHLSQTHS